MNPAMIILIPLALVAVWFGAAWLYKPIGNFFLDIFEDAADAMEKEEENEEEEE